MGIGLVCVIPLGKNREVSKSLQIFFSKDKDRGLSQYMFELTYNYRF